MKQEKTPGSGPEGPGLKHVLIVLVAAGILIGLSWIAWFKLGWFH
jgi:hypothetical protein